MKLYHRTPVPDHILREGFRDSRGTYLTVNEYEGVWFADQPISDSDGASGSTVFTIEIPEEVAANYEWIEESQNGFKGFREFLIPDRIANEYGPPIIHSDDWAGQTRAVILRSAQWYRDSGQIKEAKNLIAHIDFLHRQGLLPPDNE